eukprot:TRINITY_DN416_c0_g1_i4.p2 TRINITY_DN416_c0_g1~~TRINITY_DN416_c0_g1_i4.p2  ORF type:complete len:110 (+),score=36.92 TRINITY_DN416_c0_g1_i4:115-444(+)
MVYLKAESFEDFAEKAEVLFRAHPERFRYCMKYRHKEGKLELKATDDLDCVKFFTEQQQDAKKMEKLNNLFFSLMARGLDAQALEDAASDQPPAAAPAAAARRGRGRRQ